MRSFDFLLSNFNKALRAEKIDSEPKELYESIAYTLGLGGKRIRPVLVLMACDLFKGNIKEAVHAALAVEVFHNFTLVHDDIMDKAPIRRGKQSVYKKWDTNVAILAGDTMFAKSVQYLLRLEPEHLKPVLEIFSQAAIDVCEGQQFDMNFEQADKVSISNYISMISLKTAALIGASLETGAIIGNASSKDVKHMGLFGINLGLAFQLKDDLLDVFGDEKKFGKKTGNDIATNKKTFLYIKAFEKAKGKTRDRLLYYFMNSTLDPEVKIEEVRNIYTKLKIREDTEKAMYKYYALAQKHLDLVHIDDTSKSELRKLAEKLMIRET
jgi:geranylgeranyl diphosphate synthase, type II